MTEPLYNIYLTGHVKDGEPVDLVRDRLARQAGLSPAMATRLLGGRRTQVKRAVAFAVAAHYKAMFDGLGAVCELEAVEVVDLDASPQAPARATAPAGRRSGSDEPPADEGDEPSADDYFSIYFTQQKARRQAERPPKSRLPLAASRPDWLRGWMVVTAGAVLAGLVLWTARCAG